jgi:hypothetical protein
VAEFKNNHMIKIIVTTKDELQEIIHESVKSAITEQNTQQQSEEPDKMILKPCATNGLRFYIQTTNSVY